MWLKHVKTIINHPLDHHAYRWYVSHSQSWVVYGIVLPTLISITIHYYSNNIPL